MVLMSMGALFTFNEMLRGFEFLGALIVAVRLFYIAYDLGLWTTESWGWRIGMILQATAVLSFFKAPVFLAISSQLWPTCTW